MNNLLRLTKIQLPPLQSGYLPRPRLSDALAHHPDARLILLSAPAGFGKTSSLLEWCHTRKLNGVAVMWFALDAHDNDPARFAAYLYEAFRQGCQIPEISDGLNSFVSVDDVVTQVVNALATESIPCLIVFDDYHLITAPEIHAALSLMIEQIPPNVQVAIASRADPPLQLSRLRARGQIAELRASDLRFSPAELSDFFKRTLRVAPSSTQLDALTQASEGWAAALRLMALSLHEQSGEGNTIDRLLERFATTQQHIFDYFADEVFAQQDEPTRQFLLETSILDQLTPDLCSKLTQDCGAPLVLRRLVQSSFFLIPLSETQPVYRYHHLVADYLRQRLQAENAAQFTTLHHAAAEWYERQGEWVEAVYHALDASDDAYAAWLIEARAWEALTSRGEIMTLLAWLPRFQEDVLRRYPRLCLYFSRSLYLTGDLERAEAMIRLTNDALKDDADIEAHMALTTIAASYQATIEAYQGNIRAAQVHIDQAVAQRHTVSDLDQVRIANTAAFLHYLRGDVAAARLAYQGALALAQHIQHHYLMLDAQYYLAQIDLMAGSLKAARERCETLLAHYGNHMGPASMILLPLGQALFHQNQLVEAEAALRDGIALARRAGIPDVVWYGGILLADLLVSRGQWAEAASWIAQARTVVRSYRSPLMTLHIDAAEARWMLHSGDVDAACDWADRYAQTRSHDSPQDYSDLTLTHIWMRQEKHDDANRLLETLIAEAQAAGRMGTVIAGEIQRSLNFQSTGDLVKALASLHRALALAEPQGYVRLFLDAGQPMLRLLRHVAHQERGPYATRLLHESADDAQRVHPADLLSEREIEVLRLLAQGASNGDIGDTLVIGIGTVKSHINHIMNKLDARNRTEAVAKARSLHLLSD